MNSHRTKRKRHVSHNLLFERWLTEAMEQAFTRELKSYHTYKKALSSLKKYPLMLGSGKECRILEGFGPKLCDMLDEKLTKYADELGVTTVEALIQANNKLSSIGPQSMSLRTSPDNGRARNRHMNGSVTDPLVRSDSAELVRSQVETVLESCQVQKSCRALQSQDHVLTEVQKQLLNVFRTSKNPSGCSLLELSACLRNSGSTPNTANVLASLNQLLDSGVVIEVVGHPGRYALTTNPTMCRERILASASTEEVSCRGPVPPTVSDVNGDCGAIARPCVSPASESDSYPLAFIFADENCQPTTLRSQAHSKQFTSDVDGSEVCGYRVICNHEDLIVSGISYRIDWLGTRSLSSESGSATMVYLLDQNVPIIAPGREKPECVPPPTASSSSMPSSSECSSDRSCPAPSVSDPSKYHFKRTVSEASIFHHPMESMPAGQDCEVVQQSDNSFSRKSNNYPLTFVFADEKCQPTTLRSQAHSKQFTSDVDGSEVCGYRVICSHEDLIVSGISYRMDWPGTRSLNSESSSSTVVYLLDRGVPEVATGSVEPQCLVSSVPSSLPVASSAEKRPHLTVGASNLPKPKFRRSISEGIACTSDKRFAEILQPVGHNAPTPAPGRDPGPTRLAYFDRVASGSNCDTSIVPGGTYELVLLADVREQFGLNKVKQLLPPMLQSLGVQCESRALPVGDFLWIIRWRNEASELNEAVLDYVVERKRADDLAHSITDGRFQEQKYRMKRTQISNAIFLIEECPSMRNQRIPYETMLQAVSNSQIIDGFQVMWSRSPEDTVDWLAALTHHLHDHISLDVHVSLIPPGSDQSPVLHARMWLDFVQLAHKSPPPTVRDMFAKQLLQIHGCSGSRVAAILSMYPTPVSLLRAYDALATEKEKENMLVDIKLPGTNRTLGKALSRRIYLAYNTL